VPNSANPVSPDRLAVVARLSSSRGRKTERTQSRLNRRRSSRAVFFSLDGAPNEPNPISNPNKLNPPPPLTKRTQIPLPGPRPLAPATRAERTQISFPTPGPWPPAPGPRLPGPQPPFDNPCSPSLSCLFSTVSFRRFLRLPACAKMHIFTSILSGTFNHYDQS
jgi:hypothetical protein